MPEWIIAGLLGTIALLLVWQNKQLNRLEYRLGRQVELSHEVLEKRLELGQRVLEQEASRIAIDVREMRTGSEKLRDLIMNEGA